MPAQETHFTALPNSFSMATHVTGTALMTGFIFKANDSIRYNKSDTALKGDTQSNNNNCMHTQHTRRHNFVIFEMGYVMDHREDILLTIVPQILFCGVYLLNLGIWLYFSSINFVVVVGLYI